MCATSISIWGDSVGKGIIWNESRNRYSICKENCIRTVEHLVNVPIYNHTKMGCTALDCLQELEEDQLIPGGIAVFEFGGNDCDMPWEDISRNPSGIYSAKVPLSDFSEALRRLIGKARRSKMEPVLVSPVPIDGEKYFKWVSRNLCEKNILSYLGDPQQMYRWQEQYANEAVKTAYQEGVRLIDLRSAFLKNIDFKGMYCIDGIHPNEKGYQHLSGFFSSYIQTHDVCPRKPQLYAC